MAAMAGWSVISFVISQALGIKRTLKRAQSVAAAAQELGFTFTAYTNDPKSVPRVETELFQKAMGADFHNLMTGNYAGLDAQVFDYSCTTGNPGNSRTSAQTVAVYTRNVDLPRFMLQPGSLAVKIIDALQNQRVELNCPPGVSCHYAVHGADKERIRSLFNSGLISFIEGLDRSKAWHIEGAGKTLVLYRYGRRVKPTELRDFLQETSSIAQSFFALSGAKAASVSA